MLGKRALSVLHKCVSFSFSNVNFGLTRCKGPPCRPLRCWISLVRNLQNCIEFIVLIMLIMGK